MTLEIGGAETHLVELCKGLVRRGVRVFVASNGGRYQEELEAAGVTHIKAPLHKKTPASIFKSMRIIEKIVREHDIHLIHAHARIPAFVCGLLYKRLNLRFVTSDHGTYKTTLHLRMLTNWGERTLAVSEDIKEYLLKHYNVDERNITVTVNGIDTEKFARGSNNQPLYDELNLDAKSFKILSLSRLDKDSSTAAIHLLQIAPRIDKAIPNAQIVIVGDGEEFKALKQKADALNREAGRSLIVMPGARTDANRFYAACDVFVNISRAALEALSAEMPVILAGNERYTGIFRPEVLDEAVNTNFCCRGCVALNDDILLEDIINIYNMTPEQRQSLGAYGRETVQKLYSLDRMVDDALNVYESVRYRETTDGKRRQNVLVSGYYGFRNNGDDAVLCAITDDVQALAPEADLCVLSKRPAETRQQYNVRSMFRFNIIGILNALKHTDLLISGGGTLIQDLTSTQSLLYYLYIIATAKKRGAKVMLYANGIGPVKQKHAKMSANILNRVDLITLRDENSLHVLRNMGVTNPQVIVTADPAFSVKVKDKRAIAAADEYLRSIGITGDFFCVSVRNWHYSCADFESQIAEVTEYTRSRYNLEPLFIPMQPQNDLELSRSIAAKLSPAARVLEPTSVEQLLGIVSKTTFVLGMRLHMLIYALKCGVPVVGLAYDPKVTGVLNEFGQNFVCNVDRLDAAQLKSYVDCVMQNRAAITEATAPLVEMAAKKAFYNAELAAQLLERGVL